MTIKQEESRHSSLRITATTAISQEKSHHGYSAGIEPPGYSTGIEPPGYSTGIEPPRLFSRN
jgi:hypothetical protein